jgi:hypothetical protein
MVYSKRILKIKNAKYCIVNLLLVTLITIYSACKKNHDENINPKSEPDTCNYTYYKKILDPDSSLTFLNIIETKPNHLLLYNTNYSELTEVDSFFNVKWKKTYGGNRNGNYDFLLEAADSGNYFLAVPTFVDSSLIFKVDGDGNQMGSVKTLSKVKILSNDELVSYHTPGLIGGSSRIFEVNKFDINLNLAWHYSDTTAAANFVFTEGISDLYFASERNFKIYGLQTKSMAHLLKISKAGVVMWEKDYQVNALSTNKVIKTIENTDKTISLFLFDKDYKTYLMIIDSSGNVISSALSNIPNSTNIIIKEYGNIKLELDNESQIKGCRLKMYDNNSLLWQNSYSLNVESFAQNVIKSTTGSIYINGTVKLYNGINDHPYPKSFIIKTNALGETCF